MRAPFNLFKYSVLLAAFLFLLPSNASAWWLNSGPQCEDVAGRGYINVLTFNILFFSEEASVETRLEPIVDFLFQQNELEDPVDFIFLQEVVGGVLALSDFTNSARRLKEMLSELEVEELEYNLRTAFEIGLPGLFYTGNAILSRCEIKFSLVKRLPRESEIEILGRVIKLPRNVQMARLKIPDFGKLNAYNTHLCAGCTAVERGEQLEALFDFMYAVENFIPGEDPILLAGDFNIDRFRTVGEEILYDTIINDGFVDAYAEGVPNGLTLDDLCPDEVDPDKHCTVGVTAFDLDGEGKARRIDYIFEKDFGEAFGSTVVFNPVIDLLEPIVSVSDHSAVLTKIRLPSNE
jgi:maltose 6'-phosphate phosphatase